MSRDYTVFSSLLATKLLSSCDVYFPQMWHGLEPYHTLDLFADIGASVACHSTKTYFVSVCVCFMEIAFHHDSHCTDDASWQHLMELFVHAFLFPTEVSGCRLKLRTLRPFPLYAELA